MSVKDIPALARAERSSQWAAEPWASATRLPLRSATVRMGEPFGATIARADCAASRPVDAATILIGAPADCEKIGGASPTPPTSMAPALSPSSSGGPAAKLLHAIRYGRPLSCPDALSSVLELLSW